MFKQSAGWFVVLGASLSPQLYASDFGVTGLLDVPTARMSEDGDLSLTISRQRVADIYNLTYQATPWLETTFRYTIFNPRKVFGSGDQKKDRSYEAKLRVVTEGTLRPELAIGVRDILGSGLWGGEYVVASKRIGNFDGTVGVGWGRFSERGVMDNPLEQIDERFGDRTRETGGSFGGKLRGLSFFRGKQVGFLGGFSYRIPAWQMRMLVEYNSDSYERERNLQTIDDSSPWSYGLEWVPKSTVRFSFGRQQGNQWAMRLKASIDTKSMPARKKTPNYYSSAEPRSRSQAPEHIDLTSAYDRLLYDVERSGILLRRADIRGDAPVATLEISNEKYAVTADVIHRVLTLAEAHMPRNIETVALLLNEGNLRPITVSYKRRARSSKTRSDIGGDRVELSPGKELIRATNVTDYRIPNIAVGLDMAARFQLMDPDKPLRHQVYAKFSGRLKLKEGWNVWSTYSLDITNNFSDGEPSDSLLPPVRSDVNRYLTRGKSGFDSIYVERRDGWSSAVYYRIYGGLLEEMFAGIGTEVLVKPYRSNWGMGFSTNFLQQREFERDFALRDYRTSTGFVSVYYASPFYNFDLAVHVGRYLAQDEGVTFEARRTFDSGFSIGAFLTRTTASDIEYGQGGFDKGLSFRFPFNAFLPGNTRRSYATIIRSLERDGGRRLENFGSTLWWDIRTYHYDRLYEHRSRMIPR
ncbi:YjbH domain-containing protein [Gammaproteobacteria bacterium]|nr:YjbH domain-containing protein [Gammaproteobacteria bacterium]